MNVMVIDIGGTNIKILATGKQEPVKFPSGPAMTAKAMVAELKKLGERRFLKRFPEDFTISWSEWKKKTDVFTEK